ncbi:MAG TPA: phospholipase A [Burkholderiales bacterium]|nr:phospholipase A [Burkholderiales bacterium]
MSRRKTAALRVAAWLLCALSAAARAETLIVPDRGTVAPGGVLSVTLTVTNDSADQPLAVTLPDKLTLRARGVAAPGIVLEPDASRPRQASVKPGGFLRARYAGPLPEGLSGNLVLEPVDFAGPAIGVTVAAAGEAPAFAQEPTPAERKAQAAQAAIAPSGRDTARFASAFSPYEPNYFSAGSDGPTNAKFQVSMKFRLFNPDTQTPFLEKLYIAYSQTSIWQIGESSAPFYDSSYRPSFFFLDEDVSQWPFRKSSRLGLQAGVEHESNGKDGPSSRSLNIAYVRPTYTQPFGDRYFFSVSPKIYAYLEKADNPDIAGYRGYMDLLLKIGRTEGVQLAATLRKGTLDRPYSAELDLSIPLAIASLGNLGGYLHVQYFQGWGESLLDYNREVHPQIRVGLMITR